MKIVVCGHGGHGKDTFCEMLGRSWNSSSSWALPNVIWRDPTIRYKYAGNIDRCYEDRRNNRELWYNMIKGYNSEDPSRLARELLSGSDVYCGMRSAEEFSVCEDRMVFDLSVWVDASDRVPVEDHSDDMVTPDMCDYFIDNNGDLENLRLQADNLNGFLNMDLRQLVVCWADSVFPERTITNALTKMVMEEIPEYLMNQSDPLELADLGILLFDIASMAGVDLSKAIRRKMLINTQRAWRIDDNTGMMSHV